VLAVLAGRAEVAYAEADEPPQADSTEAPFFSDAEPSEPADPGAVDSNDPDSSNEGEPCQPPRLCPPQFGPRPIDGVTWNAGPDLIKFRNADGVWWIYKRCFDKTAGGFRYNVGPGYIARLQRGTTLYVNDFRGRPDVASPGYMNAVHGGLGTFGWHHARGPVNATPAGDDPTTAGVEQDIGSRPAPGFAIEGRMCANSNGGYGAHGRSFAGPNRVSSTRVDYTVDVYFRDAAGNTGFGVNGQSLARVRYRYSFYRSSVRLWISVLLYPRTDAGGVPFVKEPKFSALARGGGYKRMAIFSGADGTQFQGGVMEGAPDCTGQPTCVLSTDHSAGDGRKRVRWDYGSTITTNEGEGTPGCTTTTPCFNAAMRSYPVASDGNIVRTQQASNWEGGGYGLDRWAVVSAARSKAYPRDTRGDNYVSQCGVPGAITDQNGDGRVDEADYSIVSERASPDMDTRRRWEHGGWKSGDPGPDPARNPNPYDAGMTLFHGWEDERGPFDCEPLQRAFPTSQEAWGSFASFSLNDGWTISP